MRPLPGPSFPQRRRTRIGAGLLGTSFVPFLAMVFVVSLSLPGLAASLLTSLQYQIIGTQLRVSPAMVSVPKGVPGSVLVQIAFGDGTTNATTAQLGQGAYVEATLRGPAFNAQRIVGPANAPLMLPPLNLVGDYQLDNIRLIDSVTGGVRMEGSPSSVPVHVFDQVLVSTVTSRPLTLEEIQQRGIVIDENNFHAVEFEVGFVLDGQTIPVRFPVVSPTFNQSTEIIPQSELQARLVQAQQLNQQIAATTELPPELQTSGLNIQVQGINFQRVDLSDQPDLNLQIPPIPALMVIPGNIGYLNQFFSVQIFTQNQAPQNSGLSVFNIQAQMVLPPGPDGIPSTNYDQPGDDPLRFARVGPNKIIQSTQTIVRPGPDGEIGTADDIGRLYPSETGQGEFLVEGLQEGLHVMNLNLTADLDGLAAGTIRITGTAAGSVLVKNPKFSLAFTHPRTIRAGEPYTASVTVLNTSPTVANLVSVTLAAASLSGGVLESPETVQFGTIEPGQSATASFRIRAQRTGAISFSNLTTGEDGVQGRFRLTMGIDERGVALSPDSIGMPDYVNALPSAILDAATRVLGQALSVSTAPLLPPGVKPISSPVITRRVLELAEAGQRLRYGDSTNRVIADLLLDWQGGRFFNDGFDQLMRVTDAGREFRQAIIVAQEAADTLDGTSRLAEQAADLAGRGEPWIIASANNSNIDLSLLQDTASATLDHSDVSHALGYRGQRGHWFALGGTNHAVFKWQISGTVSQADLAAILIGTNGTGQQWRWSFAAAPGGACYSFDSADLSGSLLADTNCDGNIDLVLAGTPTPIQELPPQLITAFQDGSVQAGRPFPSCEGNADILNYGTVLALLFSKPMTQQGVNNPSAYEFDTGNTAGSVQVQPGGRVALVNMRLPFGAIHPRALTISGLADARSNMLATVTTGLRSNLTQGIAIHGRVVRVDSSPAAGVPVTLTMHDSFSSGDGCQPVDVRVAQVFTDDSGYFDFDFVLAGMSYTVAATDTSGLSAATVQALLDSVREGAVNTASLTALAGQTDVQGSLLADFGVTSLPQAVAAAEGLDRAVLRDSIPAGSGRVGSEVPVALRFRGRGTVTGQVFTPDGQTPVQGVAVNLFPDPDSRELGRGLFTDSNGRFAFQGVPLGLFSIVAQRGQEVPRTIVDQLSTPGQTLNENINLNSLVNVVTRTDLRGRVFESDGITPHPSAQVFVGHLGNGGLENLVAAVTADSSGFWTATQIPVGTYDVAAISMDGKRKGTRVGIAAVAGAVSQVDITLQGTATVIGRVENSVGVPVPNAIVAGGDTLVRTDTNGLFELTGVPLGNRSISAGLERNPAAGIDFPRFGSASLTVLPGAGNFVVIRFAAVGRIVGRVLDGNGVPQGGTRVSIPVAGGFQWVVADSAGNYVLENMGLGDYVVSAPAPPAADNDTSRLISQLTSDSDDEVQAAIGDAFAIFTGAADPFLNGSGQQFNPGEWGFTRTSIRFDGQTVVADIQYLREGTISGVVLNGQGVPIGARVRLNGVGPLPNGTPGFMTRGELNSDPALGTFAFRNQAMIGDWTLQAASPFYPVVLTTSGHTTSIDPDVTNVVMQFPAEREVNGRLTGTVFEPGGTAAGAGVQVHINFGNNYIISTDTNGFFDTIAKIPAGSYTLEASDPTTGLVGISGASVAAGITNVANIQLLGKGSLQVIVTQADGTPATNSQISVSQGSYPNDNYQGHTDTNGIALFENIFEGSYGASAQLSSGPTTIYGRAAGQVVPGQTTVLQIPLTATGTMLGSFVHSDLVTPITFAQVAIGNIGFVATDQNGQFQVSGVPLGTYRITSKDPVTGHGGAATATLTYDGQTNRVQLVEQIQLRGEVGGRVLDSSGTNVIPNAVVTISTSDILSPMRSVTTGTEGRFSFPNTLPGPFTLSAADPVTGYVSTKSATLPDQVPLFQIDIPLVPVATLSGVVYQPDGITPATNATVKFNSLSVDTDDSGRVSFSRLLLGTYTIFAVSQVPGHTRSAGQTNVTISAAGTAPDFALVLAGVGGVSGRVFASDATTPVPGATVRLQLDSQFFSGEVATALADGSAHYSFDNIPVGHYRVLAESQALGASFNGQITNDNQVDLADLVLGASGTVQGQIVRADGHTPAAGLDVLLIFNSQSGLPGRAVARTDTNGTFQVANIPVGAFQLETIAAQFDGIAYLRSSLTSNAQVLDLGIIPLDEADPYIVSMSPPNTSIGISIGTTIDLLFSEELAPGTINGSGIYLRSADSSVPASMQLLPDPTNGILRLVRLTPDNPLRSLTTYQLVVLNGQRQDPLGGVTGVGPEDLVGRPLLLPVLASFTTADQDPPQLVSFFPSNNAVQIDPRAVMRLSFNEPIRDSNFVFIVSGPAGPVPGAANVGLNGLVLTFTPSAALQPNTVYTQSISGVRDLAGNLANNQPLTATFATLDTIGPNIATLRVADGRSPVAGSTVPVEALLTTNEPGATVRFTKDFNPAGLATNSPYRVNITLPQTGSTTVRAIATDRYGNDGPIAELTINVVPHQTPTIALSRVTPTNGPVASSRPFSLQADASGDVAITNVNVITLGAFRTNLSFPYGGIIPLDFTTPAEALSGTNIEIQAQATDTLGTTSSVAVLILDVSDGTPPLLTILSPPDGALLDPALPLALQVSNSDNSTNLQLNVLLSGALIATQNVAVTLAPNSPSTNTVTFSLTNAQLTGGPLIATVSATDAATNSSMAARSFAMPDRRPPQLASASPPNGASRQSLWPDTVTLRFDEPLLASSVTTNTVRVATSYGTPPLYAVGLDPNNSSAIQVRFLNPTPVPGITYTTFVAAAVSDLAGNPWLTSGEVPFTFTTAHILDVQPTNGASLVAGQAFLASVHYEQGFGADGFRFTLDTNPPVDLAVDPASTSVEVSLRMPTAVTNPVLHIIALHQGGSPYPFPDTTLNARSAGVNHAPIAGNGQSSGAVSFDGADDYLDLGSWFNLQTFTIGLWVKSGASQGTYADILDNNHTGSRSWVVQYQNTGNRYNWGVSGVGGIDFDLTPGIWQYLVATLDTNYVLRLYLDGDLVGSVAGPGPVVYDGTEFLRLSHWGGGGRFWNGAVDELTVWNVALTQGQVRANMGRRVSDAEPGLVGHWRFDEQAGVTATDVSGSGHDGVLGGGNAASSPLWISGLESFASMTVTSAVAQVVLPLSGTDADGDLLTSTLTSLPGWGSVYQTLDGAALGTLITNVPAAVSNLSAQVIYVPSKVDDTTLLSYKVSDGIADSGEAIVVLNLDVLPVATNIGPGEIVYSRLGSPNGVIYVSASDGSNERQITIGEQPKLSLDGRFVAFHRDSPNYGRANLYVRDLLTGDERRVVVDTDFIIGYGWRADSTRLVYDMGCSIFDIPRDGSGQFTISSANCYDDAPTVNWIDGRIAFQNGQPGGGIGVLSSNGPARVVIPGTFPGDMWPAWSADGEWLSFHDGVNFFKVRPEGSGLLQLTGLTGTNRLLPPGAWTADGTQVIAAGYVNGTNGLFAINTDGTGFTLLRPNSSGADYDWVGSVNTGYVPGPPPRWAAITPGQNALRQSLWTTVSLSFSRSLAPGTVTTNTILFTNDLAAPVPYLLQASGTVVGIQPSLPLLPGATYSTVVFPGLTDPAGQAALDSAGQPLPPGGLSFTFTTAAITSISPTNGASFEAGTFITADAQFEPGLGADSFRFQINNDLPIIVPVSDADTNVSTALPLPYYGTNAILSIAVQRQGQSAYLLPAQNLHLTPPADSAPITFLVTNSVTIPEGSIANFAFIANSSVGPFGFLDLLPESNPGFGALGSVIYSLSGTNGTAEGNLVLAPMAGDAGSYVLTLRGTAANGLSAITNVSVTVTTNPALAFTRWKDPVNGNWSDASKWTAGVPGPTLDPIIDAQGVYTVTFDVDSTVSNLVIGSAGGQPTLALPGHTLTITGQGQIRSNAVFNLAGATLAGGGSLVAHGAINWSSGSITGPGTTTIGNGATLSINGTDVRRLTSQVINNSGTINWSGGDIWSGGGATINNLAGAVFDLQSDQTWAFNQGGSPPILNNLGILKKSGGSGTSVLGATVNNDGSLEVQSGTLNLAGGGFSQGSFDASVAATLNFGGGTMTLETNSTATASGTIGFSAGSVNANGAYNVTGSTVINGGTANFDATAITQDGTLSSGNLNGSGTLAISGSFNWTGGNMHDPGSTVVQAGATLAISGGSIKGFTQRTISNSGHIDWSGADFWSGLGATINNLPGGIFDLQTDPSWNYNQGGAAPILNNLGTLQKSGAGGTTVFGAVVNNDGSLQVQSGTLSLINGGFSQGSFDATNGTSLNFGGGTMTLETNSTVTASGTIGFSGGTVNAKGAYNVSGSTIINGGTASFNANATTKDGTLSGGNLNGTGTLAISGSFSWTGGNMHDPGSTVVQSGGTLAISGSSIKGFTQRTIGNSGHIDWNGGDIWSGLGATINNLNTGVFDLHTDQSWNYNQGGSAPVLNNLGTLQKSGAGGTSVFGAVVNNDGSLQVQSGTLSLINGGFAQGSFDATNGTTLNFGGGTMTLETNSTVTASGTIGFSAGTVNANGSYNVSGSTIINGGTANFNANATTKDGTLSGGNLNGAGTLAISGSFGWTGGNMHDPGSTVVQSGGTLAISGSSIKGFTQRTISNSGHIDWNGGDIWSGLGATINNLNKGVFDLHTDQSWNYNQGGSAPVLNNLGTMQKSGGVGTSVFGAVVNNDGSIQVESGTLSLINGGFSQGSFDATNGTTLNFGGGTMTLETNSTVTATGTIGFSGGTVTANGSYNVSGSTVINGGIVNFNGSASTKNGTFSAGTLGGSGTCILNGLFTWNGGIMTGSGQTVIATGATLAMTGDLKIFVQRTLNNNGLITWDSGDLWTGQGATLNNLPAGFFDLRSDQNWSYNEGGPITTINNSATIRKSAAGGTSVFGAIFNNNGTLNVQTGTVNLASSGLSSGQFQIQTNASLLFSGGTQIFTNGANFADAGTVRFQIPIQLGNDIDFGSLSIFFESGATITGTNKLSNTTGGVITFNKSLTVPGSMDIAGKFVLASAALTATINGTLTLESTGELDNPGTLRVGQFINLGGSIIGNAPIPNPNYQLGPHLTIALNAPATPDPQRSVASPPFSRTLRLTWAANPGSQWQVETSADLRTWRKTLCTVSEPSPGSFQANLEAANSSLQFYRVSLLAPLPGPALAPALAPPAARR